MTGPLEDTTSSTEPTPADGLEILPVIETGEIPEPAVNRQVVLVGAGHAHLQIVRWWRRKPFENATLTLISAFDRFAYSAMVPGALSGQFDRNRFVVDLNRLCAWARVELIVDRAVSLEPVSRRIELAHQSTVSFDVASVNIGSVPAAEFLCQTHRTLVCVKPLVTFPERFETRLKELLAQHHAAQRRDLIPVSIVGGGAAGVELALCFEERVHREELPIDVMLIEGGGEILSGYPEAFVRRARLLLKRRGIDLHLGRRIAGCDEDGPGALVFDDGERLPCELAIWATGAAAPAVLKHFDLPKSAHGFLTVKSTLQCTADVPVFAVGDVADIFGDPVPKAGVYAVREAKVLWRNLRHLLHQEPLELYQPQSGFLSLLNCGDGTALLSYKGLSTRASWAWWLKRWIDRRFVRQFQH